MLKKTLLLLLVLTSSQAMAQVPINKFYLGGDLSLNEYTFYSEPGITIFTGYRWNDLSLELGYTELATSNWDGLKINSANIYLDGIYSYPIEKNLEFKGLIGVGVFGTKYQYTSDYNSSLIINGSGSEASVGARAGVGLEYQINDKWAVDLSYKIQTNCNTFMGFINTYSVGIKYYL